MNYHCPACEMDLKNRYMPTKGIGDDIVKLPSPIKITIKQRVAVCPKCSTTLMFDTHPFDQKLSRWGPLPLVVFFAGLFLESLVIKVAAGTLLVLGFAWAAWVITRPPYKAWRYWRVYTPKL